MLTLTAGGAIPGDTVRVARNANVRVALRAWAPPAVGAPKTLELISHGRVIETVASDRPQKEELRLDVTLRADRSLWIAARTRSHNGGLAHTSPLYILVDGGSFADTSQLPHLSRQRLAVLDFIEARLRDEAFTRRHGPGEIAALFERIAEARQVYQALSADK